MFIYLPKYLCLLNFSLTKKCLVVCEAWGPHPIGELKGTKIKFQRELRKGNMVFQTKA